MTVANRHADWVKRLLGLLERGPMSRQEILDRQQGPMSQPSFSRAIRGISDDVLSWGKGRKCLYGRRRSLEGVESPIPVFHVQESAEILAIGDLWPVCPDAFVFVSPIWPHMSGFFHGVPWFLEHLRPSGFLGRRIPHLHPDISPQRDIRLWTDDTCLRFATVYGDSLPGSLLCGKPALERLLSLQASNKPRGVLSTEREQAYPRMALGQLEASLTSSSADGEQPKFLTHIVDENRSVLVKFSPAIDSSVGRRIADLLVCECLALETLRQAGLRAAACDVLEYGDRVFLESTRFDRTPEGGRRPLHSLFALAAQHTGLDKGWFETSVALVTLGVLSPKETKTVATLEAFGHLIANSDMHLHNLAFESHQGRVTQVVPSYDMLPMLFYPQSHHVSEPEWSLDGPTLGRLPREAWMEARPLAEFFWQRVAKSGLVSASFRHVAATMADKVASLAGLLARLPGSGATL